MLVRESGPGFCAWTKPLVCASGSVQRSEFIIQMLCVLQRRMQLCIITYLTPRLNQALRRFARRVWFLMIMIVKDGFFFSGMWGIPTIHPYELMLSGYSAPSDKTGGLL